MAVIIYENNILKQEITKSNLFNEGVDTVSLIMFPIKKVDYSYEEEKLKEIIIANYDPYFLDWDSTHVKYSYNADSTFIETYFCDAVYKKWNPKSKQIKVDYFGKENIIYQTWNSSANAWENNERNYFTKTSLDTFFNFYVENWNSNLKTWKARITSEFELINDTIINTIINFNGYDQRFKFLYDDKGRIVFKQYWSEHNEVLKLRSEQHNIYNENDLLEKSLLTDYYSFSDLITNSYIEYFWRTDILNKCEQISKNNRITVFPNPVHNILNLVFEGEIGKVIIYDINSRVKSEDTRLQNIDISSWQSGIYFINVISKTGEIFTNKFLKL